MSLRISRLLHAGYMIDDGETRLLFDPLFETPFSRNCYAFPAVEFDFKQIELLSWDAVFISHYHDDHCSLESLCLLDRTTPIYLYCVYPELFDMIRSLGFSSVHTLHIDKSVNLSELRVTPRQALDDQVDSLFHIEAQGLHILNVVDSWIAPDTMEQLAHFAPWDLVLWPFQTLRELEVLTPSRYQNHDARSTVIPSEWIEQIQRLQPRYLVPSSCQFRMEKWSWYNRAFFPISYRGFEQQIQIASPVTQVVRLDPSQSVELTQSGLTKGPLLPWVRQLGEQNCDYEFHPEIEVPTTGQVAQNFPPLSSEETEFALAYCRTQLLERWRALGEPDERFFSSPREWHLSLYDHLGRETRFIYKIHLGEIELLPHPNEPLGWKTEVPVARLYGALTQGESLTSMYVRVNDCVMEDPIEAQLANADFLHDPLLRCLFAGRALSYQEAQLRRLSSPVPRRTSEI